MTTTMSTYLNIVKPSEPCSTLPQSLAMDFKFPLDPFQQHAIAAISRDENVLVTAKTGSGKTLVGEYQIAHSLAKGKRVFYTTPIKSLSNQKFHDLKGMFPSVGIMTGDLKFRPDAAVVIMTTEILRNLLFKRDSAATRSLGLTADLSLDDLDAVVFDECHYINDRDRGAVWEETMILLPREVNLVLLSATIQGPELFAGWLGELKKKPIHLISTEYRIVPLQHGVYRGYGGGAELLTIMDNKERFEAGLYKAWLLWRAGQVKAADDHRARVADRRRGGYEDGTIARTAAGPKAFKYQMNELVGSLQEKELLPALFFVFSRKDCERYAASIEHTLIDSSDAAAVRHIFDFHLHRYGEQLARLPQYNTLRGLLEKGIAFHHSGLLPVLKEVVEVLFGRGLVKLLFATETFAVGINMPTKTVVFTGYRKYDDATGGMRMLNTDEYIQMAGRAGRRGKDDKGLVLYLPDREPESMEDVKRMMTGARATFQSRMTFHYDFLLKTMQSGNLDWLALMRQSYWYRRHEMQVEGCRRELVRARADRDALGLTEAERAAMEERDVLAGRLKGAVNAARREVQKAWSAWENGHMGPRWAAVQKDLWPRWCLLSKDIADLERDVEAMAEPAEGVWPSFAVLERLGFLTGVAEPSPTSFQLTPLGVMATEVNEGHEILMPLTYSRGMLANLTVEEVLAVLAGVLGEGDEGPRPEGLAVPRAVKDVFAAMEGMGREAEKVEAVVGAAIAPRNGYWAVNTSWVEPVWRWLGGGGAEPATAAELCADYGFYEGNLMRVLLKMVNLLEELRCAATLSADVDMLEKMKGAELRLLRDVAVCDSLYLRI